MLKVNHIKKSFKQNTVLEDINLEINKGECLYIHGKNGCGKSTLFKIICDIIQTDSGTIEKKPDTYIGALIENPGFIENYDSSSTLKNYSVGMRQKAGIIQAVMEDQNLIFFDEPTRGLDEESIIVFENMVNTLVESGKSVVIASHDRLPHVHYTHTYLLEEGKLKSEDY